MPATVLPFRPRPKAPSTTLTALTTADVATLRTAVAALPGAWQLAIHLDDDFDRWAAVVPSLSPAGAAAFIVTRAADGYVLTGHDWQPVSTFKTIGELAETLTQAAARRLAYRPPWAEPD